MCSVVFVIMVVSLGKVNTNVGVRAYQKVSPLVLKLVKHPKPHRCSETHCHSLVGGCWLESTKPIVWEGVVKDTPWRLVVVMVVRHFSQKFPRCHEVETGRGSAE
jgi:hypothetical protein